MWACEVPPSVVKHAGLLGRDSWKCFNTRSYRALPLRPHDNRVFGELTLSHHAATGVSAYVIDPTATDAGFHLLYGGTVGVTLSDEPQLLDVNLVRSNGSPALTGQCHVDIPPQPGIRSTQERFVSSGRQAFPLERCRRPRAGRPRRGRPRLTFARPARCLATRHPRRGTPPWPDCRPPHLSCHKFTCGRLRLTCMTLDEPTRPSNIWVMCSVNFPMCSPPRRRTLSLAPRCPSRSRSRRAVLRSLPGPIA